MKSKVWSNVFFSIPLGVALWFGLVMHALLIALVLVISTLYHLAGEKRFKWSDKLAAYALIAYNLFLCYLANFKMPYFLIALIFVAVGFYFLYYRKRDDYEWHLSCAIITLFCQIPLVVG